MKMTSNRQGKWCASHSARHESFRAISVRWPTLSWTQRVKDEARQCYRQKGITAALQFSISQFLGSVAYHSEFSCAEGKLLEEIGKFGFLVRQLDLDTVEVKTVMRTKMIAKNTNMSKTCSTRTDQSYFLALGKTIASTVVYLCQTCMQTDERKWFWS